MSKAIVKLSENFPVKPEMMEFYELFKSITATVWRHSEVMGSGDRHAYITLDSRVQKLYDFFLTMLLSVDDIVSAHWAQIVPDNIREEFIIDCIKSFIEYMEKEHALTYKKFVTEFLDDSIRRQELFTAFVSFKPIQELLRYSAKYITNANYKYGLFANLLIEHVLLPVIFTFVSWTAEKTIEGLNKRVPGFIQANTMIMADEATHADFAIMLINKYPEELKPSSDEAVAVCAEFIEFIESCSAEAFDDISVPGINAHILCEVARAKVNELIDRLNLGKGPYTIGALPGYALNNNLIKKESNFETNATIYSRVDKTDWSGIDANIRSI